jgi:cell division protein FtsB
MELSKTVGAIAIVLGVVLSAGFAVGEDGAAAVSKQTMQMKVEEREAQRRAALEEQQKRKDAFERACNKPMKSDMDRDLCRVAYKRLDLTK